jgi:hypothetical protein
LVGLELLLHGFYVHGLFHDYEVVWDVVGEDRLDEWPRGFVLLHGFDDVLALDLEAALFSLFELLVIGQLQPPSRTPGMSYGLTVNYSSTPSGEVFMKGVYKFSTTDPSHFLWLIQSCLILSITN